MSSSAGVGPNVNKTSFGDFVSNAFSKYDLVIKIPKKVHTIAKSTFSLGVKFVNTVKTLDVNVMSVLDKVSLGFKGVAGGFTVLMVPVHLYETGKNGIGFFDKIIHGEKLAALEKGVKFGMNVSELVEDAAIVLSTLSAFKIIPQVIGAWMAPVTIVTGAVESIGLVFGSIDHYRVDKFRKAMKDIDFDGALAYVENPENAGRISLSLGGVSADKIAKFLKSKKTPEEQEAAVKLLKDRATSKTTGLKLSLISGSIATVATGILAVAFIAPLAAPLLPVIVPIVAAATPILGIAATVMFIGVTTLSLAKIGHGLYVDYKFNKAIKVKDEPDAPPPSADPKKEPVLPRGHSVILNQLLKLNKLVQLNKLYQTIKGV